MNNSRKNAFAKNAKDTKTLRRTLRQGLICGAALTACWAGPSLAATIYTDGVYSATNRFDGNTIAAFRSDEDGTLIPIAEFATGGNGGAFGAGVGLDPLISEDSVINVDNRFLLAVNAGSNTVSSLRINPDLSLTLINTASTGGVGPNSIAHSGGLVYVANTDSDGVFTNPTDQSGNITGLRLDPVSGELTPIEGSTRELGNRPADVEFSTDGSSLVVSSFNALSSALPNPGPNELVSFGVVTDGNLTATPTGNVTSTELNNPTGRNVPGAIGFEIVEVGGEQIVIATESREFLADGGNIGVPGFQTGSLSSWVLGDDGSFTPLSQDIPTGPELDIGPAGPTSACWIVVTPDGSTVYVASASGSSISSFRLNGDGTLELIESNAALGVAVDLSAEDPLEDVDGFIDIAISADGSFLYQLLGLQGAINVYGVDPLDASLTFLQKTSGLLPETNTQGLVTVRVKAPAPVPLPAGGLLLLSGLFGLGAVARRYRKAAK